MSSTLCHILIPLPAGTIGERLIDMDEDKVFERTFKRMERWH
jgi:hypothetical protein